MNFELFFGEAQWVAAPDPDISPVLRRDFSVQDVQSARLTVLGFGSFECFLNGVRLHDDYFLPLNSDFAEHGSPAGEVTAHRIYVRRYDVTQLLQAGNNSFCMLLGSGWYTGIHSYYHPVLIDKPFGTKKAVWRLELTDADGEQELLSRPGEVLFRDSFVKISRIPTGEEHDYTQWSDGILTDPLDPSWQPTVAAEAPGETVYMESDCPTDRIIESIRPICLAKTAKGTLYDAGTNLSGYPVLFTEGRAGTVTVRFSEELTPDGEIDLSLMPARQTCTYTVDEAPHRLYPRFTWLGFRYFLVEGEAEVVEVRKIHTDVAVTAEFESDNDTLNWIFKTFLNTQLCNMHGGIPSDCPHLERLGYTGDGQLVAESAMLTLDAEAFYRKWIGDISDCQDRLSGHVQYCAPHVNCGGGPGGWGCAIVEVPYRYWKQYGDARFLRELFPQMLHYFSYLETHSEFGLVTSDQPGKWCLGDWCPPEPLILPPPFVNNYFYIRSMLRVCEFAPLIGEEAVIPGLEARIRERKAALSAAYFDPASGDFLGNRQGANAFALDIGMGDERTRAHFLDHYRNRPIYDTGIFGTEIVTRLLFAYGETETAYRLLTAEEPHGFAAWKHRGATTFWEYWGETSRSHSHPMFGAVTAQLFTSLLGIRQSPDSAGFSSVEISPALIPALGSLCGSILTPHGRIAVAVTEESVTVTVPDGIHATLRLGDTLLPLPSGVTAHGR